MEKKINLEIHIADTEITHFNSLKIIQSFNRHHEFELIINQDVIEHAGSVKIDQSKSWIGKSFLISIDHGNMNFKGLVCEVNLSQSHGLRGDLIIKGFSPTILMETGIQLVSHADTNLSSIVEKTAKGWPSSEMEIAVKPVYKETLKYITQYKESNFTFLNRLSKEYGEFFYYDGKTLIFGKPAEQKTVSLVHGQNLNFMNTAVRILPTNFAYYSYRSEDDNKLDARSPSQRDRLDDISQYAYEQSSSVFDSKANVPIKPRVDKAGQLEQLAQKHSAALASGLTDITGESTNTALNIGCIADIKVSHKIGSDSFVQDSAGKFLVTEITHSIDGLNRYTNSFKGVNANTEVLSVSNVQMPQAEAQVAIVKENNDPSQTGRIKVQMLWQKNSETTDWIRVLTPDGGSSEPFSKNRGYVFIPEVGDQVVLGFRYNDPDRPFVMGSIFHGNSGGGGADANHMKSIATRSGHLIEFNDSSAKQGITITDINKNIIHIDTSGNNITITANENLTLNAKNLQINVQENMDVHVGKNKSLQIGENMATQIGQNSQVNINENYMMNAANITEVAKGSRKSKAANITENSKSQQIIAEQNVNIHAKSTLNSNSGERSNFH
ncbi:type VI secretion system Vgr family protein [Pedobacter sp. MR2016-24]|uniref:type VI secretion system Vgr family protein n=1 Tax=Pedobacter sp. MR2016-24 TaxID=2994466 RepID=UPI00224607D3|nr:phage baseplate assembly protein V [Pedobacter sp. MR2016-24]MCX2486417.1 phage baseplate assembly protein V [Pedobacter sp. MR2016-24]